ncbi:hypothetical protein [Streptomyces rubellomurinus]|uniref:hypothetical protein n=1 Tax=Streptomyces rubellomurinus (strain ATCC 31215) TaxID=359131 RepID=UPI000A7E4279|nr:hypothetical protein [Streptomyces rubellomurinus]
MGVAEILLHTHDITQGLAVEWQPPAPLCAAVLARLFPDAPPRRTSWIWKAARSD